MLFGGAVGGGKTAFLLGDFAQDVPTPAGPFWRGILFRRTYPQLEEVIAQSLELYPQWFDPENRGLVKWVDKTKTWTWANGATLKMRYAEHENDWMEYQGHQYGWIGYDELTQWPTPTIYLRMKARLRSAHPEVTYKRIRASANPGGPGHEWVKQYFGIGDYPLGRTVLEPEDASGMRRIFIPSRVQDNKILMENDPGYVKRIEGLGSPELVKAWLEGDWNVVQGAYFPEFSVDKHVIAPFEIPTHWTRIRAMDWGSAAPFAVYWIAISDGTPVVGDVDRIVTLPRGAAVVYREWYGAKSANVGLKLHANEVAAGIARREEFEAVDDAVIDPSCFAQDGGPSIAERMSTSTGGLVWFRRGDNKRIPGWDQVRERLKGVDDVPMLYMFSSCANLIRTLPALQHDDKNAEDVDTDGEDHAGDALRYGLMARPWTRDPAPQFKPKAGVTLDELFEANEANRRRA